MGITLKNNKSVTKNITIKGDDGVGIKTITSGTPVVTEEKTTTPITVTLTDETTQNFNVEAKNGSGADNTLIKPTTAPSATQLVAVDNTNTQTMLNLGDGLSVENGSLKASGGAGGKLYYKTITINFSTEHVMFPGISEIYIYFYESNDTLYDANNINTLYEKIQFANCNFYGETGPTSTLKWILGCVPQTSNLTFYYLRENGEIRETALLYDEIDDSNIIVYCDSTEV